MSTVQKIAAAVKQCSKLTLTKLKRATSGLGGEQLSVQEFDFLDATF